MTYRSIDKAIGRMKEAAGALTGNKRSKDEGRIDRAKGSVKHAVDRVTDAVSGHTGDDKQE